MTPVTDEPILPEEDEEPLPPVGHVRVVYLGPVAPHWEVQSDFGDPALIEEFRRRTMARLVLLPPHDPQYRRNRERVIRDAERENILLEWDLGRARGGGRPAEPAARRRRGRRPPSGLSVAQPLGAVAQSSGGCVELGQADPFEPQSGSVDLRRCREVAVRRPELGQTVLTGPLDDTGDERPAPVDLGLIEVEPEQRAGRLLALAPFGAAPVPGLGQLGVGADQLSSDQVGDVIGVGVDDHGQRGELVGRPAGLGGQQLAEQRLGVAEHPLQRLEVHAAASFDALRAARAAEPPGQVLLGGWRRTRPAPPAAPPSDPGRPDG